MIPASTISRKEKACSVGVYVDDIILAGKTDEKADSRIKKLPLKEV